MNKLRWVIVFLFLLHLTTNLLLAQVKHEDEINTTVPELKEFHTTIYEIWHNAWPNKDIAMLTKLLPDIQEGFSKLQNAKLPGILREKSDLWNQNLNSMAGIILEYKSSTERQDSVALLDAAEKLHTQYEKMVRTVRPVLKELEAFHQSLYILYHYYTPEYKYNLIKKSVNELSEKMVALNKAKLPERLKEKEAGFIKARKELAASVKQLKAAVKDKKNKTKIVKAIEAMHSKYQSVEAVFD
jgi:hypothetical protein